MKKLIIRIGLLIGCPVIANAQNVGIGTLDPGTYIINVILSNNNLSGLSVTVSFGRLDIIVILE